MKRFLTGAILAGSVAGIAPPAFAIDLGLGLFKRKTPNANTQPEPSLKTKQLVATLQSDLDIARRKNAAEELRNHDPKANADLIPTLAGSLLKDPSPDVRILAAESLGAIKSVYATAGSALEKAESEDPDKSVRAAAKSALWQYGLNGYKPTPATPTSQTVEPPLAKTAPVSSKPVASSGGKSASTTAKFQPISQGPVTGGTVSAPQSSEPPLARPKAANKPQPVSTTPAIPTVVVPQKMPSKGESESVALPKPMIDAPPLPGTGVEKGPDPLPLPSIPTVAPVPTVSVPPRK